MLHSLLRNFLGLVSLHGKWGCSFCLCKKTFAKEYLKMTKNQDPMSPRSKSYGNNITRKLMKSMFGVSQFQQTLEVLCLTATTYDELVALLIEEHVLVWVNFNRLWVLRLTATTYDELVAKDRRNKEEQESSSNYDMDKAFINTTS